MNITDTKKLGTYIKNARKEQHLTQADLAIAANVGIRFLVDPETGRNKDKKFEQKNWQKMRILEEKIQKYFDDPKSKIKIYEINEKLNS